MRTRPRHFRTAGALALSVAIATLAPILIAAPAASADTAPAIASAAAAQSSPTTTQGTGSTAATPAPAKKRTKKGGGCGVLSTLNPFSDCNPITKVITGLPGAVAGLPGAVAGAVASGIMNQVAQWMVDAASTINGFVVKEEGYMTTPELQAGWYQNEFGQLVALGAGLAGLVALIAIGSAALRRDAEGLGEVVFGIFRAGFGTGVVIAITVLALGVADGISNAVATSMSHQFFQTVSGAWSAKGFGGFGSAALAFIIALVQVIAALFVWLELLVRDAAIYVAVLFFPIALAAGIWPSLRQWVHRLSMLLLMFVILKPVILIVLALAGNAAAAGLSFGYGGALQSVGTILVGVVVYAIAAFSPWTLMFLLGTEVGAMRGARATGGGASAGGHGGGHEDSDQSDDIGLPVGGDLDSGAAGGSAEPESAGTASGSGGGGMLSSLGGAGSLGSGVRAVAPALAAAAGAMQQAGGRVSGATAARVQVAAGRSGFVPSMAGGSSGSFLNGGSTPASSPPPAAVPAEEPPAEPPPAPVAPVTPADPEPSPATGGNESAYRALGHKANADSNEDARRAFGAED
jgi:type IV secretion system protein TrbL